MTVLGIDFETKSAVDLRKAGAHRYAEDASTDIWCLCWAFDDEPVATWRPGQRMPARIFDHVFEGGLISGWNVGFERAIWNGVLGPRYGWPLPRLEQYEDTAAAGAAMGLPRNLGDAAKAMSVPFQKDDEGHRLMLRMAKPRRPRKGETPTGLLWWDEPDRIARLIDYCIVDVEVERALRKVIVPLAPEERETWLFDARMNDRGVLLDLDLIHALQKIAVEATADLDAELEEVSGIEKTTQVGRLTQWINEAGVECTSLAKGEIERMLAIPNLPNSVRAALEIRRDGAKTSTKKLKAMLACVSADGRARGQHLYHGAGTGRWSGRLIQVQNFTRGSGTVPLDKEAKRVEHLPQAEKDAAIDAYLEGAIADFLIGDAEVIRVKYGKPMFAVSDMLRSCMRAARGKRYFAADFSAIEGRVTAWLAGEEWKIRAFEEADAGTGPGIYELTAAGILGKNVAKIGKAERQAYGKVPELALGFQGGVQAFDSMAKIYRVDMAEAYEPLAASTDAKTWARALKRYEECVERGDAGADTMTREAWIASEVTKVLWRKKHPATVALWKGLEEAAFDAVLTPGTVFSYRQISYVVKRGFLWCRLPSGRCLAYGSPKIQERKTPWGERKSVVTCLGVDSVTRRWTRFALYGGLATENCVQGVARDSIRDGCLECEANGYPIVLTVHDEAVAEVDEGFGSLAEFERLLAHKLPWAEGLPVVATGYEAHRYRKDG